MFRFFVLPLIAYFLTLFQSAIVGELLPNFIKPDLMLILITHLGTSPLLVAGAILVFFCGLLQESFSGSPPGLFLFIYLSIFFFIKLLGRFLILGETIRVRIILVAVSTTLQVLLLIFLPPTLGISSNLFLPNLDWILPQVLITCAAGWPLFQLFKKLEALPRVEPSPLEP
jgi:asparagine N-glycosylation enzyme membrane subunit Stt3